MKILVPIKRVIDYAIKIRVDPSKGPHAVQQSNVKMSMNPFCEIAVEEAIRLKEGNNNEGEVIAVSIGPKQCSETIRTALAMGADRGVHIETKGDVRGDYIDLQPWGIAGLLKGVVEREGGVDLVLLGKQSIDSDCGQTGPLLAGLLNAPQATFAAKVTREDDGSFIVDRETDAGTETIKLKPTTTAPAIITCDLRLNTPRYPTMPNIMKAKKKPVEVISLEDMVNELGLSMEQIISPRNEVVEVYEPPPRKEGELVGCVEELLEKLKEKGLVA
ncbi:predicted protein [Thalassiosira pseudonana CCMP1335]|uniref:Electron transfer flavoprotein subunit beta n=1 Tax=Thalassiosira pseudonana TaxID=35128 RepID=B5YMT1_THAPS|nr:predicted protein [Thalassiosira pseudonana CCMP1335]ACI64863.1 predicted protein [Thalassiosira pseudonana CCMP1335]|eukprot:g6805.t1 g6805   contig23:1248086-1249124(+)